MKGIKGFCKGNAPWNKGLKGAQVSWNKGLTKETDARIMKCSNPKSEDTKRKMSVSRLKLLKEGKITTWAKNKKFTKEHRNNLSLAHTGKFLGEHHSIKTEFKKGEISLDKHPCWLGGKSFEPYAPEFNKEFKNLVRLRDNFCCLNCGMSEQKSLILFGKILTVHHVDYNKKNTCLINCVSLCNKCHGLTSRNRNEWTSFYQEKLSGLYKYTFESQTIQVGAA